MLVLSFVPRLGASFVLRSLLAMSDRGAILAHTLCIMFRMIAWCAPTLLRFCSCRILSRGLRGSDLYLAMKSNVIQLWLVQRPLLLLARSHVWFCLAMAGRLMVTCCVASLSLRHHACRSASDSVIFGWLGRPHTLSDPPCGWWRGALSMMKSAGILGLRLLRPKSSTTHAPGSSTCRPSSIRRGRHWLRSRHRLGFALTHPTCPSGLPEGTHSDCLELHSASHSLLGGTLASAPGGTADESEECADSRLTLSSVGPEATAGRGRLEAGVRSRGVVVAMRTEVRP